MPGAAATSAAVKSAASSAHTAASSAASSANKAASSAASSAAQKAASAKASIENADTGVKELNSIKNDVLAGKDGLGSIVNEVSKKNKKVDRFFHCLNPVGCACADANRVPIMAVASIIGAVVGGCALCGALGLSDLVMRTLPWGAFYNIDLTLPLMVDWICAEAILQVDNSPLRSPSTIDFSYLAAHDMVQNSSCWIDDPGYFTGASRESYNITYGPGLAAFFDERNTALWEQFPPTAEMPQGPVDWFANLTYFGAANVEAYPIGVRVGYLFTYAFNQWGMCGFPQESWAQKALQVGAAPNSAPVYYGENGEGTCRQWEVIGPWAPEKVQDCKEGLGVDAFSLIMGAFGGVIKVFEPLSRMKKATDEHQKTVILIIITISAIVPLIAVLKFNDACLKGLDEEYSALLGAPVRFGPGAICFLVSVVLLIPIAFLHVIIPSGVHSSWDTEAQQVQVTVSDGATTSSTA